VVEGQVTQTKPAKTKEVQAEKPSSASPQVETSSSESEEEDHHDLLSDWDSWMATSLLH